jgi:hypothetical protein
MTREDYAQKVHETASAILTECDAKEWKEKNEGLSFQDFESEKEYDGQIHSILDATCGLDNWKDAVEVLQATDQDPDHVDSGLYEGCGWKRILVCMAFEVFRWDVYEAMQEMFEDDQFDESVLAYPDTSHQRGFFPQTKKFKIPDGPWVVDMHDAVKILVDRAPKLSVVFEGSVERLGVQKVRYVVSCRRVYNQTDTDIENDMVRCKEEFGVREL